MEETIIDAIRRRKLNLCDYGCGQESQHQFKNGHKDECSTGKLANKIC
jgi:hypothetical protein